MKLRAWHFSLMALFITVSHLDCSQPQCNWLTFFKNNVNIEVKQNTEVIFHKLKLLANPLSTLCAWDVMWRDVLNNAHAGLAWFDL